MTFRTLDPAPGRRVDEVSVAIHKFSGRKPRVRVTFHVSLCEQMNWTDATLVEVLVGEGTDQGMVRFKPATTKGFRLKRAERGERLVVSFPPGKGAPDFWRAGATEYGVNPNDKSLTIRLPWAQRLRAVG